MQRFILAMCALFGTYTSMQAQETCLSFELIDTLSVDCSSCITLEAPFTQIFETDVYSVSAIDPNLLYPIDVGTPVGVGVDDTWSGVIPLGFDFCFFDQTYSSIVLGSNGILSFNLANAGGYNEWEFDQTCPSNQLPVNSIFMPYHDIDPSVCGTVRYQVYGEAPCRKFVVSYDNVCLYSCTNLQSSSQVVLSEGSNAIQIFIVNKAPCAGWNQGNALIGIQNITGSVGFTPPGRNTGPWQASNEAWQFNPNGAPLGEVTWLENGVEIGTGENIEVCPDSSKYYSAELRYEACSSLQNGGDCANYQVTVSAGNWPGEVSWELINQEGVPVLLGGAPFNQNICLPNACYTLQMFDSFGDGWNGSNFTLSYNGELQGSGTIANGGVGSSSFCLDAFEPGDEEDDEAPLWASDSIFVSLNLPQYQEGLELPELLCEGDDEVLLSANEPGGSWFADCENCLNDASFVSTGLSEGQYEIMYQIETECGPIEQFGVIQIEAYPEIVLSVPELICEDDEAVPLEANEMGGTWNSVDCETCINELDDSFSSNGIPGQYEVSYTFGENCITTESTLIEILQVNSVELDLPEFWCASSVLDLGEYASDEGLWTSSCEACIDENDDFIGLNLGEGSVGFTYLPDGICPALSQDTIVISPAVDATISAPEEICESADAIEIFTAEDGGVWLASCEDCLSDEGIFNPSNVAQNEVTISYTIDGVCSDADEVNILILEELSASISEVPDLCESEQIVLSATGDQGFWTANCGNCIDPESGLFDASISGPGAFELSYEFNEPCAVSSSIMIDVSPNVDASIADLPPLCENADPILLSAADAGGEWSADCENCLTEDGLFDLTTLQPGVYEITYTIEGVCSDEDEYLVEVIQQANASIIEPDFVCLGSELLQLNSVESGGTWSAVCDDCIDTENGVIDLSDIPVGSFSVEYLIDGFCGDLQTTTVEVVPCDLTIPNVFSPNGDGVNDYFEIENLLYFGNSRFQVFNRWGQEVYSSANYKNNWNGSGFSEGTYYFLLDVPGLGSFRGEMTLLR